MRFERVLILGLLALGLTSCAHTYTLHEYELKKGLRLVASDKRSGFEVRKVPLANSILKSCGAIEELELNSLTTDGKSVSLRVGYLQEGKVAQFILWNSGYAPDKYVDVSKKLITKNLKKNGAFKRHLNSKFLARESFFSGAGSKKKFEAWCTGKD